MTRKPVFFLCILLCVLDCLLLAAIAQAQVAVNSSGYATLSGPGVNPAPASAPAIWAPQISFAPSSPSVGATNATAGNVAGASNSTLENLASGPSSSGAVPVYSYGPATTPFGYAEAGMPAGNAALGQFEPPAQEQNVLGVVAPGFVRLGDAHFDSAYNVVPDTRSLVRAAQKSRQRQEQAADVRTYTTNDLVRVHQTPAAGDGVTTASITPDAEAERGALMLDRNLGFNPSPNKLAP